MQLPRRLTCGVFGIVLAAVLAGASGAAADVVTDANAKAAEIVSKHPATPIAVRMMAVIQVSVFEAVNAVTGRYPAFRAKLERAPDASVDAAVAAAARTALLKVFPAQQAAIEAEYQAALKGIADGPAKTSGIAVGERAATAIVALCADDGWNAADTYRPAVAPGVYAPTVLPAVPHWGKRRPWIMSRGDQFRPGPPPAPDERDVDARLHRDQGDRRQGQHAADAGADGDREILGGDVAGGLLAGRAVRGERARARRHGQRPAPRRGGHGHGRRADRRVRREVHVQLLAADHRDPQRTRRQRRDDARGRLDAVHRHADAPRVPVRALHRVRLAGRRARGRDRQWPGPQLSSSS